MARKKKDEEEDLPLYLWLRSYTKRLVPPRPLSMIPSRSKSSFSWARNQLSTPSWKTGTKISSKGPGLSAREQAAFFLRQNSLRDGAFPAYLSYGKAGLLDPKAPIEAYGYGGFLGLGGWKRGVVGGVVSKGHILRAGRLGRLSTCQRRKSSNNPHLSAPGTALLYSHIAAGVVATSGCHSAMPTTPTLAKAFPSHSSPHPVALAKHIKSLQQNPRWIRSESFTFFPSRESLNIK